MRISDCSSDVCSSDLKETMRRVLSLSVPQEQEKFAVQRRPQNPNSPAAVYQSGEVVTAAVRNISFINPRVAQVRFVRTVTRPGNAPDAVSHWIATINIKYVDRPTTEAGRLDNPLGFQVVRSEERRVGKEGVSPCRSRWSRDH